EDPAAADSVTVHGTAGKDNIQIAAAGNAITVGGLHALVTITGSNAATNDQLIVKADGGNDTVTAGVGLSTLTRLTLDGGGGNDTIQGGDGADTLIGGDGHDFINGGKGNDLVQLGAGDDTFEWNPGEGSDVVEGGSGKDTMQFNGSSGDEVFDLSAN